MPNFLWQWRHQFPFLELMHNVAGDGRDILLPPLPIFSPGQMLGFIAALLVPSHFYSSSLNQDGLNRALGWAYLVFLGEMMLLRGKCITSRRVSMMFVRGSVDRRP